MFPTPIGAIAGQASEPGTRPTPAVECFDDEVRITTTSSRKVTINPTLNDRSNDGAMIQLTGVNPIDPSVGTIGSAGNNVTIDILLAYSGTVAVPYTVETATGAVGTGTITIIVEGPGQLPEVTGVPDIIQMTTSDATKDIDVIANDTGTGPIQIAPGSLVQPVSGPTIAIVNGKIRVTRNSAGVGVYYGSYKPMLVDGSKTGDYTYIEIQVSSATITVPNFEVTVSVGATQPFVIDALSKVTSASPVELTPGGLTQPNGSTDSAAISGTGASGKIEYTRSTTPAGTYTMTYKARVIASTGVEGTGTITIKVVAQWHIRPERGGRQWPAGHSYYERSYATWQNAVGKPSAQTMQMTIRGESGDSWEGIWGGQHTEALGPNMANQAKSQTSGSTVFAQVLSEIEPDSRFVIGAFEMWPDEYSTHELKNPRRENLNTKLYDYYDTVAGYNKMKAGYIRFGRRIYNRLKNAGWTDMDLFVARPTHEMNQSNITQVYTSTRFRWRAMTEQLYAWMREGFADAAGDRMRIIHSPGSYRRIGDSYSDWIPQTGDGKVDMLTISYHPSTVPGYDPDSPTKNLAGVLKDFWDGNDNEYGHQEVLDACASLGMLYANPEWGPNFGGGRLVPCPVSDLVVQQFNKFCRKLAKINSIGFECQYNQTMLQEGAYTGTDQAGKDAWKRMVAEYKKIWVGQNKGTPLQIDGTDFAVSLTGSTPTSANPIAACTGSEDVRINRIAAVDSGIKASITGSAANQRVKIEKNGATGGTKKVTVEMTLATVPYLFDIDITVNIS